MSEGEPREDSPAPQLSPYHGSPQHAHKFASKHIGHVDQGMCDTHSCLDGVNLCGEPIVKLLGGYYFSSVCATLYHSLH